MKDFELFGVVHRLSTDFFISTCVVVFCPAGGDSSVSQRLGNHLPIYRNSFT